jgi:glycosyltransferase involved in cell wall biosynthesis
MRIYSVLETNQMKTSVIITSYNLSKYISDCIRSVLNQSIMPDEIILADDASTDDSVSIAKSLYPDLVVVLQEKNGGAFHNTLSGLNASSGEIVVFIDADDTWPINKIERVKESFQDENVFLVTHNHRRVNDIGMPTGEIDLTHRNMQHISAIRNLDEKQSALFKAAIYREGLWFGSAYSLRRSAINLTLFNDIVSESDCSSSAYLDLVLAPFVAHSNPQGKIIYLSDLVFDYRIHSANSASSETIESALRAIKRGRSTNLLTKSVLVATGAGESVIRRYELILSEYDYLEKLYGMKRFAALSMFPGLVSLFIERKNLLKELARLMFVLSMGAKLFLELK